jgi:hypothetical protein
MRQFIEVLVKKYKDDILAYKLLHQRMATVACSTGSEDCLFLYLLVRYLKPTNILEIGTFVGSTLFAIITACEENKQPYIIHTIDNHDELKLENKLLHSVKVHKGWSREVLKNINTKFDFVFSDANLDKETATILENLINKDTFFATHDFVPPSDKGISSIFNMIKYTKLKNNLLIMPHHKCNWIYENKSYQNMHDEFSENYVKTNKFEIFRSHNELEINNCVAVIIPEKTILDLKLDKENYIIAKNIISDKIPSLIFDENDYILLNKELYIKLVNDNIIIKNEFIDNLPRVKNIYLIK